ncbi:hypothetical protein LX32DRAFT_120226 [Colletotrichum zoysiae]|uniref:Secreted protein n=1 Tax=Colletotrichum zoysiae TaxID=1216348 RepID=A0AAD9LWR2_9PEZI|nr:hypothetical protein LX32DRAFT_120226 [Colletotrichum zoysiae]
MLCSMVPTLPLFVRLLLPCSISRSDGSSLKECRGDRVVLVGEWAFARRKGSIAGRRWEEASLCGYRTHTPFFPFLFSFFFPLHPFFFAFPMDFGASSNLTRARQAL